MKKNVKALKKSRFEKPEILEAEFIACGAAMLATKIPAAAATAKICNLPVIGGALGLAGIY